ncbi:MAG: hypothetical protein OXG78_04520 [Chloroflexi bacterium]|nr:hypothetical protein [Chloroflexota bacterium]
MMNIKQAVVSCVCLSLPLFFLSPAQTVFAADITVDSNCSLADAITSANADAATGSCPAGQGADTIHLSGDITLAAELPQIASEITIEGGQNMISGDDAYRIFGVANGRLKLHQLIVMHGAAERGGAIINDGVVIIIDSSFISNTAERNGGAIANFGELNIVDSSFVSNSAGLFGGAIFTRNELTISDSSFFYNSTYGNGGAIHNHVGQLGVADSSFSGNLAEKSGGAIDNHGERDVGNAQLSITGSAFFGNIAKISGGAISSNNYGTLDISNSSFAINGANFFGGAVSSFGDLSVANSTFASNSAKRYAGAVLVFGTGASTLAHLTVANNRSKEGGGIFVLHKDTALNLYNSLIVGNDGGDCNGVLNQSSANLIADGSCEPALSGDPLLGALVVPEDGSPAYLPLLPDSPAIDAAHPEHCTATDQTGAARTQGAACDIGAVEFKGE